MKYWFLTFFLLYYSSAISQTVFQPSEVDSIAEPRGGVALLDTFLQSTLRKPIRAEAEGVGGTVTVSGIIETDGRISSVKIVQGLRSDCNREAIRVFSLFNAWKPAQKNGQPVRQQVTVPIMFQTNMPFTYVNGNRIDYYGTDNKVLTDSSQAYYKRVSPVDTNGLSKGDVVVYESKAGAWTEYFRLPFVRKKYEQYGAVEKQLYSVGNQNYRKDWEGQVFVVDDAGTIVFLMSYKDGKRIGSVFRYHTNGALAEKKDKLDKKSMIVTWHSNGQVREIRLDADVYILAQTDPEQVTAFWDSTGHQLVKNGNGQASYYSRVRSKKDTSQYVYWLGNGSYENGLKQGVWVSRYTDGSYFNEELYSKGVLTAGKTWITGKDTLRYTLIEEQPEFEGGMKAFGLYLSSNLKYPRKAIKAGAQGKVLVSFIVNADGSVSDVEAIKGIGFGCDEEAVRVVTASSGRWKPGLQRGEKVRVKYNLPINFGFY